jgi:hypothetical protein
VAQRVYSSRLISTGDRVAVYSVLRFKTRQIWSKGGIIWDCSFIINSSLRSGPSYSMARICAQERVRVYPLRRLLLGSTHPSTTHFNQKT